MKETENTTHQHLSTLVNAVLTMRFVVRKLI